VPAIAIDAAADGDGLFDGRSLLANVAMLQMFNGTVVLAGLVLAVVVTERRKARAAVELAAARLNEVGGFEHLLSSQSLARARAGAGSGKCAWRGSVVVHHSGPLSCAPVRAAALVHESPYSLGSSVASRPGDD
jgi:hypothetical protein